MRLLVLYHKININLKFNPMKISPAAVFVVVLMSNTVLAQDIKLAGVEYFNYPKAALKDVDGNYQASFQEFAAYVNFPTRLKNQKTILVNGFQYRFVGVSTMNDNLTSDNSQSFHRITYNFTVIHRLTDSWMLSGRLIPTLASDFKENLSGDDFTMQGGVMAIRELSSFTSIGGGLIYSTRLGKPLLLPGFHFRYGKDKHRLFVQLPALVNYSYQTDTKDKLSIGFRMGLNGGNFNISSDKTNNNREINRLNYSRANIGPLANYKITNMIQLEAWGGLSTARKYRFEDVPGNDYRFNSGNSPFVNIGIALVVPAKNKINYL